MSGKHERFDDVMRDARSCATLNVRCGKCLEATIVYILPNSILARLEDAHERELHEAQGKGGEK